MVHPSPLATLLLLPDLRPLAGRLRAVLADLSGDQAAALEEETGRLGRAVLFRGDWSEAERLARRLREAGLLTSLNLQQAPPALAAARA